jgi:hypothetical protein
MGLSLDPSPKSSLAGIDPPDVTFLSRYGSLFQVSFRFRLAHPADELTSNVVPVFSIYAGTFNPDAPV